MVSLLLNYELKMHLLLHPNRNEDFRHQKQIQALILISIVMGQNELQYQRQSIPNSRGCE
jgi:hypothetical protein